MIEGDYKIIYSLENNPVLGWLMKAFAVLLNEKGELSLKSIKLMPRNLANFGKEVQAEHLKNVTLLEEFSLPKLAKKFHTKDIKPDKFLAQCTPDFVKTYLRPYIEIRIWQVLDSLRGQNIYLYENLNPAHKSVYVHRKTSQLTFSFKLKDDGDMLYILSVKKNHSEINLLNPNNSVLLNENSWSLINNEIHHFENHVDGKKLIPFFNKTHIDIPQKSVKQYLQKFVKHLLPIHEVKLEGIKIIETIEKPECKLLVVNGQPFKLVLLFKYQNNTIKAQDPSTCFITYDPKNYSFNKFLRDKEYESECATLFNQLYQETFHNVKYKIYELKELLKYLSKIYQPLKDKAIEIALEAFDTKYELKSKRLNIGFIKKTDGYILDSKTVTTDEEIPFSDLRKAIVDDQEFVLLSNGKWMLLPDDWIANYKQIFKHLKKSGAEYKLANSLNHLLNPSLKIQSDEPTKELVAKEELKLSKEHQSILRGYQKKGFDWMVSLYEKNLGGCLADDMGLGKTLQTIALLTSLYTVKKEKQVQVDLFTYTNKAVLPSIIVMPTSLIHNWKNEIKKFSPQLKILIYSSSNRSKDAVLFNRHHIILTSYGLIRNDIEFLKKIKFNYIILDESQAIKNPTSKIAKTINELSGAHKLALTGTPIENSLIDLWSQINFINPGHLGSYTFFKKEYVMPIEKYQVVDKVADLKKLVDPYILRRTKEEVAPELPKLTEQILSCEMSDKQRALYEVVRKQYHSDILDNLDEVSLAKNRFAILKGIMELRLIANHPSLYNNKLNYESGKFDRITENLSNLIKAGHKILVFSQFVKHLSLLENHFNISGTSYSLLTGDTNNREKAIDNFTKNPNCSVFLISLKSGGFGLNLTEADYVFMLDPWWNPFAEKQAIDRAHRIGQDKKVFSYKFITDNSIEDKIIELQQKKRKLAGDFISQSGSFASKFNSSDVKALFS